MKVIIYAGTEFLTGDDIATALLEYSESLGEAHSAHIVEIPVRESDGSTVPATFLVGPASQIVVKNGPDGEAEITAPEIVAELERMTREQRPVARPPHDQDVADVQLRWSDEF
jgi:hypothetical protein